MMENVTYADDVNMTAVTFLSTDYVLHRAIQPVFLVGRYVYLVWFSVGFVGNIASAVIWNASHMYDVCSSAHYLVTISICDFLCQFLYFFYYLKQFWNVENLSNPDLCLVWSILYMIPLYISELLLLGLTIEKLISLRNPFRSGWFSRHQRAPKEIVWIVVSVTVLSLPNAYIAKIDNRGYCVDIRTDEGMQFPIWNWVVDIFIYTVIPISVIIINVLIIREAKHSIIGVIPKHRLTTHASINVTKTLRQSTIVILRLSFFRVITLLPETLVHYMFFLKPFDPHLLPEVKTLDEALGSVPWRRYIHLSAVKYVVEMVSNSRHAVGILIFVLTCRHFKRELNAWISYFNRIMYACVYSLYVSLKDKIAPTPEENNAYKF
ncbi:uncharacterized protein LOC128226941 [Mya arenaria]|nr:uncharacterized protein LOC128226941 [Mya arenaria]